MNRAENVDFITIHYTATPIETEFTMEDIDAMHRAKGWAGIGYHFYFPRRGGMKRGRRLDEAGAFETGAHSYGENRRSIGLCYEGGVTRAAPQTGRDTRTGSQKIAMIHAVDELLAIYGGDGIDPAKGPVVTGHRDMPGASTQCPGFDAGAWWREVQENRTRSAMEPWWMKLLSALLGGRKAPA